MRSVSRAANSSGVGYFSSGAPFPFGGAALAPLPAAAAASAAAFSSCVS